MTKKTEEKMIKALDNILMSEQLLQAYTDIQNCDMELVRAARDSAWETIDDAVTELTDIIRELDGGKKTVIKRHVKFVPKEKK